MTIELVRPEEFLKLDPVFESEWNAAVPDPRHSDIVAEVDGAELIAFVTLESVVRVGNVYVAPNHRGARGAAAIKRLLGRVVRAAPNSGRSFVAFGHEDRGGRYEALYRALGMRRVGGAVYRRDFFREG